MGPMSHQSWEVSVTASGRREEATLIRVAARCLGLTGRKGYRLKPCIQLKKKTSIKFKIYFFSLNDFFFFLPFFRGYPRERDP